MYLSKLVGEITHEDRPNLHEICQIGCLILNKSKTSLSIVSVMKF